jgi:hypothetical protein
MPPAIESVTTDGTVAYIQYKPGRIMAGIPIGPNDFVVDFLVSAHTESLKLSEVINNFKTAGFLQQGFLLDYYCFRPQVNHLLRGAYPPASHHTWRHSTIPSC